jgi:hypothetical protein
MCNATPNQLPVLNSINTYGQVEIDNFIRIHNFELNCLIQYGINVEKLNNIDLELTKKRVNQENISKETLVGAGMHQSRIDQIFGPEEQPEPEPIYYSNPSPSAPPMGSYNAQLIDRIVRRKITVSQIQEALLNDEISEHDLMNKCFLDQSMIDRIRKYTMQQMPAVDFSSLPPLQKDRTDFYFLGMPSAGKSCLIASMLSHWMRIGICNPGAESPRSAQYFRILGGGFSKGILPIGNPNNFIDYIEVVLSIEEERKGFLGRTTLAKYDLPINILDMAGEKFERVATEGQSNFNEHKNYLQNNNSKALFFVLDYSVDNDGADAFEQSLNLIMVLNNLESMGILDHTDSIYLVVTKADMFNCPMSEYDDRAEKYVSEYYGSFKNRLLDLHNKYDFEWEVLAYSIGECTFGQLLVDFNPRTNQSLNTFPQSITNKVLSHTARYQKGARGLFSN